MDSSEDDRKCVIELRRLEAEERERFLYFFNNSQHYGMDSTLFEIIMNASEARLCRLLHELANGNRSIVIIRLKNSRCLQCLEQSGKQFRLIADSYLSMEQIVNIMQDEASYCISCHKQNYLILHNQRNGVNFTL